MADNAEGLRLLCEAGTVVGVWGVPLRVPLRVTSLSEDQARSVIQLRYEGVTSCGRRSSWGLSISRLVRSLLSHILIFMPEKP